MIENFSGKIKVIKIAHCSHSYFLGDGEKELKKLVLNDWYAKFSKQLKKLYPEIDVECWAPEKLNRKNEEYVDSGVLFRFFPVTFSPMYALDFSAPMIRELKKEIDKSKKIGYKLIVHIHELHNLHGLIITSLFGKENLIVQHHGGSWPLKHIKQTKRYKLFFILFMLGQIWENFAIRNVKIFYGLSSDEIKYLKKKVPYAEIRFQTMGIDEDYFANCDKKCARKILGLPYNKKILLFIGRIADIKGIDTLLEAMKILKKQKKEDILLKIIGFGPQEPKFKNFVKGNKLENIEFLGGVFGEKKMLYLSAADAFVLASSKEGAPVTIMEALARNLPCVVSDVGGVRLMIDHGKTGVIIRPKNSMDLVRGIKEVLSWKNISVRKTAEKYRWKKIIDDTVKDYLRL